MKCILFGGSGQVGGAVARALIKSDACTQLTMVGRRIDPAFQNEPKVEQIKVDTNAADLEAVIKEKAQGHGGHDVAISCLGIGSGTLTMDEETLMAVEVHMLGKFARGCKAAGIETFELLTAYGVKESHAKSKIKVIRVMGKKHKVVVDVGFEKLAIFKPGMIVGNVHSHRALTFLTSIIPDALGWGNIHQDEVGGAFVAHLEKRAATQSQPVVTYGNKEMKQLLWE